jgi:hypothetical protein
VRRGAGSRALLDLPSGARPLREPRGSAVLSGIHRQLLDGGGQVGTCQPIGQTVIGPGGVIKSAQGDVGGNGEADREQEANNALNCR